MFKYEMYISCVPCTYVVVDLEIKIINKVI